MSATCSTVEIANVRQIEREKIRVFRHSFSEDRESERSGFRPDSGAKRRKPTVLYPLEFLSSVSVQCAVK
jgi:hypothetical protein